MFSGLDPGDPHFVAKLIANLTFGFTLLFLIGIAVKGLIGFFGRTFILRRRDKRFKRW